MLLPFHLPKANFTWPTAKLHSFATSLAIGKLHQNPAKTTDPFSGTHPPSHHLSLRGRRPWQSVPLCRPPGDTALWAVFVPQAHARLPLALGTDCHSPSGFAMTVFVRRLGAIPLTCHPERAQRVEGSVPPMQDMRYKIPDIL